MPVTYGKYQLLRRVAVGGMAEVFLGIVTGEGGFKKPVAIKRILPDLSKDQNFVNMFLDEARILARFNHPNIVQIYDLGKVGQSYFLSMEFIRGVSLYRLMQYFRKKQITIPFDISAKIIACSCEGLEYAHNFNGPTGEPLDLIHRDVSPHNIMLSLDGVVKVMDFGVAKAAGNLTRSNPTLLKGKVPYMSPEQLARKLKLDRRSDVFSLGTILFELITGKYPFEGVTELDIMMSILNLRPLDAKHLQPEAPEALLKICSRAMQKERDFRYQSAWEMRQDLEEFLFSRSQRIDNYTLSNFLKDLLPKAVANKTPPQGVSVSMSGPVASATPLPEASERLQETPTNDQTQSSTPSTLMPVFTPVDEPILSFVSKRRGLPLIYIVLGAVLLLGGSASIWWMLSSDDSASKVFSIQAPTASSIPSSETAAVAVAPAPAIARPEMEPIDAAPSPPAVNQGVESNAPPPLAAVPEPEKESTLRMGYLTAEPTALVTALNPSSPKIGAPIIKKALEPSPAITNQDLNNPVAPVPTTLLSPATSVAIEVGDSSLESSPVTQESPAPPPPAPTDVASDTQPPTKPDVPPVATVAPPTYQAPELIKKRRIAGGEPEYPAIARAARKEAVLLVKMMVTADGEVREINFLKTDDTFETVVRNAIQHWKFSPFTINGRPVDTYTVYKFVFRL